MPPCDCRLGLVPPLTYGWCLLCLWMLSLVTKLVLGSIHLLNRSEATFHAP